MDDNDVDWLCASSNALNVSGDTVPLCADAPGTLAVEALDDASDDADVVALKFDDCVDDVLFDDVSDFNRSIADAAAPIANSMAHPLEPNIALDVATGVPLRKLMKISYFCHLTWESSRQKLPQTGTSCRR